MKKQINEIKKMQLLAGLITESEYRESLMNEANNIPIDGELRGNKYHVDFDDLGNLWSEKFKEKYGHEYDDLNDEDNDNFEVIQDEVINDLETKLSNKYKKPITLKFSVFD
jgi:hypothetical protein